MQVVLRPSSKAAFIGAAIDKAVRSLAFVASATSLCCAAALLRYHTATGCGGFKQSKRIKSKARDV